MKSIEFVIERTIAAPIDQVFSRLVDIDGYDEWMPSKGTILKRTRQTSPGEVGLGTTFLDETTYGPTPGEIVELDAPREVVFHWWDKSKAGKLKTEGWPGYSLRTTGTQTLVRLHAKLNLYGAYRLAAPLFRRLAVRERTVTLEALKVSFEPISRPG
ncbi:SRPBCC family protein [Nocardioides sp.]|uniref:SRPBCC family protein n=1 Tax=Nocardioides sp. TaxID=35761 RepID=UPI002D7E2A34|nr:SRPBCC family protein [Nocardioides sp.]HET8959761.1 SRPBCC family protein [Nocardioides sp.]